MSIARQAGGVAAAAERQAALASTFFRRRHLRVLRCGALYLLTMLARSISRRHLAASASRGGWRYMVNASASAMAAAAYSAGVAWQQTQAWAGMALRQAAFINKHHGGRQTAAYSNNGGASAWRGVAGRAIMVWAAWRRICGAAYDAAQTWHR